MENDSPHALTEWSEFVDHAAQHLVLHNNTEIDLRLHQLKPQSILYLDSFNNRNSPHKTLAKMTACKPLQTSFYQYNDSRQWQAELIHHKMQNDPTSWFTHMYIYKKNSKNKKKPLITKEFSFSGSSFPLIIHSLRFPLLAYAESTNSNSSTVKIIRYNNKNNNRMTSLLRCDNPITHMAINNKGTLLALAGSSLCWKYVIKNNQKNKLFLQQQTYYDHHEKSVEKQDIQNIFFDDKSNDLFITSQNRAPIPLAQLLGMLTHKQALLLRYISLAHIQKSRTYIHPQIKETWDTLHVDLQERLKPFVTFPLPETKNHSWDAFLNLKNKILTCSLFVYAKKIMSLFSWHAFDFIDW